jgi:hypothetical protein
MTSHADGGEDQAMRTHLILAGALIFLAACATPIGDPPPGAQTSIEPGVSHTVILSGTLTDTDLATYREVLFTVPPGARSLTITLDHDGREARTTIDTGIRDPHGFRGWSGSNKSTIFIAENESTPSFRAGPLTPGTWALILGVPAIRPGVTTNYEATITFNAKPETLEPSPGWRRGDFHAHTGHSDASCANSAGARLPCPVHETLDAAVRAKLDFVSVTDHNTFAQNNSIRELAPFYPGLTVIRGAEITTFQGHANALGVADAVDFQLGHARLPNLDPLFDQVDAQGGILSVNHPALPSGPLCMGCGWTAETDWSRVTAIEVVNGDGVRRGIHEGPASGIAFWEKRLREGHRLIAIGGSDNHDPTDDKGERQSPLGKPATVVWTNGAREADIVAGVREGRVFLDLDNVPGRILDVTATADGRTASMGGQLLIAANAQAEIHTTVEGLDDYRIAERSHNIDMRIIVSTERDATEIHRASLMDGASEGWLRYDVRDTQGRLLMVGNPIWFKRAN